MITTYFTIKYWKIRRSNTDSLIAQKSGDAKAEENSSPIKPAKY